MLNRPTLLYAPDEPAGGAAAVTDQPVVEESDADKKVPKSWLNKERRERRELEARLAALEAEKAAAAQAELSEVERLKAQLAATEKERDTLKGAVTHRDRSDLVRRAAKHFHDAEDAVALLSSRGALEAVETAEDAVEAIKALAKERPHLVKAEGAPDLTTGIERVLQDGLITPHTPTGTPAVGDEGRTLSLDQLRALSAGEMTELRTKHPEVYSRSLAALGQK